MSRQGLLAFGAAFLIGLLGLIAVAGTERREEAFTLGVVPGVALARLTSDKEFCQRPVEVVDEFRGVKLQVGTYRRPGPQLVIDVRDVDGGGSLARARVAPGYEDNSFLTATLDREVPEGERVAVCVRNVGQTPLAPYGNSGVSNRNSSAYVGERDTGGDMTLVFLRDDSASVLGLVPSIVERASLFHGSWASAGAYWVLLVLVLVGPATLAALAVRAAVRDAS
jgi:hypothetical protein